MSSHCRQVLDEGLFEECSVASSLGCVDSAPGKTGSSPREREDEIRGAAASGEQGGSHTRTTVDGNSQMAHHLSCWLDHVHIAF